ncbi:hypothetical protein AVEN_30229-1 [Araneus ventricosus]|uniref:Uncharacterized protein n=1 Tax=Araneus ventricosus TaxID=182803 RepID=A0A4Y2PBV1_ARAVE|nr:hypothetical protein AVEN_30229-1 [Araneus ventricosus]
MLCYTPLKTPPLPKPNEIAFQTCWRELGDNRKDAKTRSQQPLRAGWQKRQHRISAFGQHSLNLLRIHRVCVLVIHSLQDRPALCCYSAKTVSELLLSSFLERLRTSRVVIVCL